MSDLQGRIGYVFANPGLLETALTHPSREDGHENYQRLEFLGDAVVELAVSRWLFDRYPDAPEGHLTRARASLVKEGSLAEAARGLGLGAEIRMGVGESRGGGRDKPSILSDVLEAVIGAVYLDGGQEAAFRVVYRALESQLKRGLRTDTDYKTRLQEYVQSRGMATPTYRQLSRSGPDHDPLFEMEVMCGETALSRGKGRSKQAAQQAAARRALEDMQKREKTEAKGH